MTSVTPHSWQAWLLASRPKTLAGAALPVWLGWCLASTHGRPPILPGVLCLAFALLMQIDANLINDYYDFVKGADREDRLGPKRACAEGWISPANMRRGIALITLAACATGCGLLPFGGWALIPIGLFCVVFAFLYTAGPYPLAYHGWGDILVLVFFGLIPVGCTYFLLTGHYTWQVALASLGCGLVTDTLLLLNNYRDRKEDAISGKRTIIVVYGERVGELLYLWTGIFSALLCLAIAQGNLYVALLPQLYLIPHYATYRQMVRIKTGKDLNRILGQTARNMLIYGLLLGVGLLL